jgi:alpha/beta superfamily hydrolase
MLEIIRPSTVLPAIRKPFSFITSDGFRIIGEISTPLGPISATILCFHPNPSQGGMMDSHVYKKASNRLPAMAGVQIIRINTRGTTSEQGTSEGVFDNGEAEKADVIGAIKYVVEELKIEKLWVMGWSFGTDLSLRYATDPHVLGLILLSPPLQRTSVPELEFWTQDGRPVTALVPEFDTFLNPHQAALAFAPLKQLKLIPVEGAKHLWVGEPAVYRVLTEIVNVVAPQFLPLPEEYEVSESQ